MATHACIQHCHQRGSIQSVMQLVYVESGFLRFLCTPVQNGNTRRLYLPCTVRMATQEDYICRVESGFLIKVSDDYFASMVQIFCMVFNGRSLVLCMPQSLSIPWITHTETSAVYSQYQAGACVNIVKKIYA